MTWPPFSNFRFEHFSVIEVFKFKQDYIWDLEDRSCKLFIYLPAMKHSDERTIRFRFCLKLMNFDNLANTASFLPAFLHSEDTWSSKLRFLPISIPSNFYFALYFPKYFNNPFFNPSILLSFMLLVLNHSIA